MSAIRQGGAGTMPALEWGGVTRRGFMKGLAAVGALAGGFAAGGCERGAQIGADGRPLLALSAAQARTLGAVAEAVIPTQPGFPDARQAEVVRRFDEELSFVSPSIRSDLQAALGVLEYAPVLYGQLSRFAALDIPARREVLQAMNTSRVELLRAVGNNAKILVQFFYFGHPSVWAAIGYDGPFGKMPEQISEQRAWYAQHTAGGPA
ncbi:twin-arginine translocation signal domain-containing protein [Fontimonas sp. SYSU GA230001]|uniref:twin-arginine translocation signal domain-containing protein n=1 Tax=Fontimonas sp. SYSU GA230001 TaxID=3142450 RepID=UPI0032B4A79A